mmetsp:Transcript_7694/g.22845  ORF Transcript_7694/g.22845 Transcript_7694/m.22845 type:complete len:235 (+) Transcript_7694:14-718(+)
MREKPVTSLTDNEKHELRKCYMKACSGDEYGSAGVKRGGKLATERAATSRTATETDKEEMLDANVHTARMDEEECGSFCRFLFDLRKGQESFIGPMLWANLMSIKDDKDGKLSYTEVVDLVLPLLKGCISQRAAFLFGCYDVDNSGLLSQKELFDVVKKAPGDGPFEKDLVGLLRQGKKEYALQDYIAHCKVEGENDVVRRCHQVLGIDTASLPDDESILNLKSTNRMRRKNSE